MATTLDTNTANTISEIDFQARFGCPSSDVRLVKAVSMAWTLLRQWRREMEEAAPLTLRLEQAESEGKPLDDLAAEIAEMELREEMAEHRFRVAVAAATYISRQIRATHPEGDFDRGGRWYPSKEEAKPCCRGIRSPARAYPYSYMTHCRSMAHCAELWGADVKIVRRAVREAGKQEE